MSARIPEDELITEIRRVAAELGHPPTYTELKEHGQYSIGPYYRAFGSVPAARDAADVGQWSPEQNKVNVECEVCGTSFERWPADIAEHTFCSPDCKNHWERETHTGENHPHYAKVEVNCAACGQTLRRRPARVERYERQFCDKDCLGDWKSEHHTGEQHPRFNQQPVECANCGQILHRQASHRDRNSRHFCDRQCHDAWRREEQSGEQHHQYDRVTVTCAYCGAELERQPHRTEANDRHFCDRSCKGEWWSENVTGDDHPLWDGGYEPYYGANWPARREQARNRDDYRCQLCRLPEAVSLLAFGRELDVHHIEAVLTFDNRAEANKLSNLVTVCRQCHYSLD